MEKIVYRFCFCLNFLVIILWHFIKRSTSGGQPFVERLLPAVATVELVFLFPFVSLIVLKETS
jgi:hypothetical protein